MKKLSRWGVPAVLAAALVVSAQQAEAQVTIAAGDIPVTPGEARNFCVLVDSNATDTLGIPVDLGFPGPDRTWDFSTASHDSIQSDTLFDPTTSAFADSFPDANRGVSSFLMLGGYPIRAQRFERVQEDGWLLEGVVVSVPPPAGGDMLHIPIAPPEPVQIAPLPLSMGMNWAIADTFDTTYQDTLGMEYQLVVSVGGFSEADAWGSVQIPGGEVSCLRVHSELGGVLSVYPIIFGIPLPVPIYQDSLPTTQAYTWYSPGLGEVASITSKPLEQNPDFTDASLVRIRTLQELSGAPEIVALPENADLAPAWPNPFNASTTIAYTLPREASVHLDVFDILGRRVARLAEGRVEAGRHRVHWNAGGNASGTYIVRLTAPGITRTRRVTLVR